MASPQEFEVIDDAELMAIRQSMQYLAQAYMDSTVSRQALQSLSLQTGADVMELLIAKVQQSPDLEEQNAYLRDELRKQTTAAANLSAEVAQLKEDLNEAESRRQRGRLDVLEALPTNVARFSG